MNHQEQYRKECEHEKAIKKLRERQNETTVRRIHPAWFVILGTVLVIAAVLVWTFIV